MHNVESLCSRIWCTPGRIQRPRDLLQTSGSPRSSPAALAICKINNIGILKSRIHNARNPRNPTNSRNRWRFQAVSRDSHDSTHAHYNAYEAATPAHDPRRGGWLWPLCYCGLTEANRAHAQEPCALHDETEMQKHRQAAHRARPIRAMHPPTAGKHAASSRAPSTGRCRPIACAPAGHESPAWPAALAAAHQDEKARRSHKPSLDSMPVLPSLSATARMRHGSVSMGTADDLLPFGLGSKAHLSCGRPQTSEVMAVKLDSFTEAGGRGLQGGSAGKPAHLAAVEVPRRGPVREWPK